MNTTPDTNSWSDGLRTNYSSELSAERQTWSCQPEAPPLRYLLPGELLDSGFAMTEMLNDDPS
ncbi:MAG: hypothetical protein JOY96_12465 [Verrucomicrobia bacterium]|nr:hypothetical protein [Verrucomicrobiota bacterium]MBV9673252.1 hypothetical protein [Verrucomicrobiota bacterium]